MTKQNEIVMYTRASTARQSDSGLGLDAQRTRVLEDAAVYNDVLPVVQGQGAGAW